jgi:putative nucleotidyltransferase with HDIG domain
MCRACAYFHDIGKLSKPQYFIENTNPESNPHDDLTPTMSALVLLAHVKDGVDLALKHGLNKEIINVIREHHGTSVIHYFYHRAMEQKARMEELVAEGKATEEDIPVVNDLDFRYPGPKARSRESAIISLADAVESTSRSLVKPSHGKIMQMIVDITEKKLGDGQLDDCELTLGDLSKIRNSFSTTLCGVMHNRVPYPGEPIIKKKRSDLDKVRDLERKRVAASARASDQPDKSFDQAAKLTTPSNSLDS